MPVGQICGFMPELFGQKQYGAYLCFKGFGLLLPIGNPVLKSTEKYGCSILAVLFNRSGGQAAWLFGETRSA